jgi:hypothetical protein
MVGVAQLVEHLVVVQDVAGSSPVTHPIARPRATGASFISADLLDAGFDTIAGAAGAIRQRCGRLCIAVSRRATSQPMLHREDGPH